MIWLEEEDYMKKYGNPDYQEVCTNDKVCWMNYRKVGIVLGADDDGIMKVSPRLMENFYINSFLVQVPEEDDIICAFKQSDDTRWAHVVTHKMDSNLGIWVIYIFGCDDSSYTCHYLTLDKMEKDLERLKEEGIKMLKGSDFFFTN